MYDFLIIGAGISGAMIAREFSRYDVKTLVLDKENDVANHATIANSAIVHSGHDPKHGSLKAMLSVRGNELYDTLEKELHIPLLRTGGLLLAHGEEEEETLFEIEENARLNGVKTTRLSREALLEKEPHLADDVTLGLDLPTTKVTYPWEVALNGLENAIENGVEFKKNEAVEQIEKTEDGFIVKTQSKNAYETRFVINAAGAFADRIAAMVEGTPDYTITPRRGDYIVLDQNARGFVTHTIYPVPHPIKGKGVLLTPQTHGNLLLGPTSELQDDPEDVAVRKEGLSQIKEDVKRLMKDVPFHYTIRTFAGVRATSTHKDFYIKPSRHHDRFIHVAGIDSPGLTAAPAIGEYVVNQLIKPRMELKKREDFNPYAKTYTLFQDMSEEEKKQAFKNDPRHGRIICRCEKITEGDLMKHIERTLSADTVKAVKKRVRIGSGRCQGGYCQHQVIKKLAEVQNKDATEVDYYRKDTPVLKGETKEVKQ
ncbi:MAG: NAD(P)/FAD-dependent oxidoreductase [Bacillota bacterium]